MSHAPLPRWKSTDGPLLRVEGLTKQFGGVTAVAAVDFTMDRGQVVGLIGPNGAGKSTLIGLLSGTHVADTGRIYLEDQDITETSPAVRARCGIGRTHQIPRPFAEMTVLENLLLARHYGAGERSSGQAHTHCFDILKRTGLADQAQARAGQLQLLDRKRLELARALALGPRLLLLDEIGAGLVAAEIQELVDLVRALRKEVQSILIVEHVMELITKCCDRVIVLNSGRVLAAGTPGEVLSDSAVAAAYLGTSAQEPAVCFTLPAQHRPSVPGAIVPPARRPAPALLKVENVDVDYGGVRALRNVSLEVRCGEIVALLGANGAGKTTLARAISGVVPAAAGSIALDEQPLSGRPSHAAAMLGVAHCMEGRRIFGDLTVQENLLLGAIGVNRTERRQRLGQVLSLLPELAGKRLNAGTALSGGEQQMLAIGRALMAKPRLVIFDEISLGLAPVVVQRLYEALAQLRSTGVAMLLIEQNIERALALADWAYVLARGEIRLAGPPAVLASSPELTSLYLS
jgi:branched-chain amino acid transport system ATP-binding protein